jgi:O-antigen/teichoic acid export membrane protein
MHRQILSSTVLFLVVSMLQALMQVVMLPFQTHYLTPGEYGILATVIACSTVLNPLFGLGLHGAAQRFTTDYNNSKSEQNVLWSSVILLGILACLATGGSMLLIVALLPNNIFADFSNVPYLIYAVINSIAMGVMLIGAELLRMYHQPRRYALAFSIMYLCYIPLNILFIGLWHWQVKGALLAYALMPWIGCLILILTNLDFLKWQIDRPLARELLKYSFKILPHFTFSTLNTVADRLLLIIIIGKHFTGIYAAGSMIASLMPMLVGAISFAIRPQIYTRFLEKSAQALTEVGQLSITAMLLIALAGANIALWSPEMLQVLTSIAYHGAWPITILLTLKYIIQGVSVFVICSVLFNKAKVQQLLFVTGGSLLILIACSIWLAPNYGMWGIAVAGLISSLFELFFSYCLSRKTFTMLWPVWRMLAMIPILFIPSCGVVAWCFYAQWPLWITIAIKLLFSLISLGVTVLVISRQHNLSIPALLASIAPKRPLNTGP